MLESTNWDLVESSAVDSSKYDNICPTIVTWTPEMEDKESSSKVNKVCIPIEIITCSDAQLNKCVM